MRAFCTVSAPLEVCASSAETLSPGSRFLALRLLGNQQPKTLYFLVDAKSRVREVYTQTCLHFATQGMLDTELFGLAVLIDGEYMFADPESKLSKYGPKSWRSSHTHGLDANGRPLLELHFRVQFYIESPFMLKDETSRHNYYLQLKCNALQRDVPKEYSEQSMILLAGLALQADFGDAALSTATVTHIASGLNQANPTGSTTTTAAVAEINSGSGHDENSSASATKTNSQQPVISTPATTTSATSKTTTTTTLPKINKRTSSEKVLRLSTFVSTASLSHATTTTLSAAATSSSSSSSSTTTTSTLATSSTSSASVFPISCSLKRSFNAVAATLSPSSSSSSINRSASLSTNSSTSPPVTTAVPSVAPPSQIDYFRLEDYLPLGLRTPWAASALRACYRENRGMSIADAELHYIQQACLVQESINAHTFRMRMSKNEHGSGSSWFVVYAKGIKVYGVGDNPQQQITFLWPNITKLSFERKKFEIRSGDNKITLFASSDEKNKMLLTLCKETHQFSMKIAARLKEVVKREEEESNCLHACYIYSRSLHLPYKNKNDQRISVISSTSSNTTSGIVSDRVHSEDELEIMINTPPAPIAAPSTESLALAHLLDRPSVSRQTSSVGQVSLKELEDQLVALTVRQQQQRQCSSNSSGDSPTELSNASTGNSSTSSSFPTISPRSGDSLTATESPSSQHNVGSQCSSTCSTVVVATPSDCNSSTTPLSSLVVHSTSNAAITRRNSTSSSLELGFSHTAQNSVLSEVGSTCADHGYIHTTAGNEETESISGVYTLADGVPPTETSGVYTMHSSEMTGQSSEIAESESQASSHYGIFQPSLKSVISDDDHLRSGHSNLDSVDGGGSVNNYHSKRIKNEKFRLRSDSNVSASGSFRGDGSDPTDSKHTLLSAEELTDLIVGRGTYPCRQTVSNTLDSDCDYVTLPLSMQGESYIAGHQDTAPTDDHVVDDLMDVLLPTDPPAPPQRIDSNALNRETLANLSNIRLRSPPPYNARHEKTGLCGPPVVRSSQSSTKPAAPMPPAVTAVQTVPSISEAATLTAPKNTATTPSRTSSAIRRREPPPYPVSAKPRPTSLVSLSSSTTSSSVAGHPPPLLSTVTGSMSSLKSEEITARFITTRPQINILKAHTSVVSEHSKPSYAAPTFCSTSAASSTCSATPHHHHLSSQLSQHSVLNSNYVGGSVHQLGSLHNSHHLQHPPPPVPLANPSQMSAAAAAHVAAAAAAGAGVIPNTIGIPLVPYSLHAPHKSMSSLHQQPPPPLPPYADLKPAPRTCVLLPVIKPRQYLPPPPPSLPRQPPPPPPPQLATVYTSQLARKQLELYQQQLYSDVDYVIYPIQDPAVSQQEYLDAKQGSLLAAMAQSPPPPHPYLAYHHHAAASAHAGAWDACKGHAIYRSTPYLPLALSTHSRYASTQNLSDTYVQIPGTYSPLYSPSVASLCSSYEPPPPPPLHPAAMAVAAANTSSLFARSRSDDNILNSLDSLPKVKRLPPPPPPPYVDRRLKKPPMPTPTEKPPPIPSKPISQTSLPRSQFPSSKPPTLSTSHSKSHMTKTSSGAQWAGERPKPDSLLSRVGGAGSSSILAHLQASVAAANMAALNASAATKSAAGQSTAAAAAAVAAANAIDIALLREKSKNLDLPLISALCNDRSLLKQTKAFVPPKSGRNATASTTTTAATPATTAAAAATTTSAALNGNHCSSKSLASNSNHHHLVAAASASNTTASQHQQQMQQQSVPATTTGAVNAATGAAPSNKFAAASLTKPRKTSVSHRHPNDKLPPLPMQLAEANNYVMDPAILKHHKSYNSQT